MKISGRPLLLTPETERIPRWVRGRDAVLTLLLWIGCAWMWLQLFPEEEKWLAARARADLEYEVPAVLNLLRQGLLYTGLLLVAYVGWTYQTWRQANRDTNLPAPPTLPPEEEAAAYGLPPEEIPALRAAPSVTVHTGRDGRVNRWQAGRS